MRPFAVPRSIVPGRKRSILHEGLDEKEIAKWLCTGSDAFPQATLCHTYRLFGSPFVGSKIFVPDLELLEPVAMEIRHGVGIDRDTGNARAQIKFDYEVAPVQSQFAFRLRGEDLVSRDLGLLSIGLRELQNGHIPLGGNTSRGLGGVRLQLIQITATDLSSATAWLDRLLNTPSEQATGVETYDIDAETMIDFIDQQIRDF